MGADGVVEHGEVVEACRRVGCSAPSAFDVDDHLRQGDRLLIPPGFVEGAYLLIQSGRSFKIRGLLARRYRIKERNQD
jgi:hypothetical protein